MNNIFLLILSFLIIEVLIFFLFFNHYKNKDNKKNNSFKNIISKIFKDGKETDSNKDINLLNVSNNEIKKNQNENNYVYDETPEKIVKNPSQNNDTEDIEDLYNYDDEQVYINKEETSRIVINEIPQYNDEKNEAKNNKATLSNPTNWSVSHKSNQLPKIVIKEVPEDTSKLTISDTVDNRVIAFTIFFGFFFIILPLIKCCVALSH